MAREKNSKGQNSPDPDTNLELKIDGLESTQKVLNLLAEHKKGLAAEISEMNSILDAKVASVFSECCEKELVCSPGSKRAEGGVNGRFKRKSV